MPSDRSQHGSEAVDYAHAPSHEADPHPLEPRHDRMERHGASRWKEHG